MKLIKGQRFKSHVNACWGTVICSNDLKGANETQEAYDVQFDNGKFYTSWHRCHIYKTESVVKTMIRRAFKKTAPTMKKEDMNKTACHSCRDVFWTIKYRPTRFNFCCRCTSWCYLN